jgi:Fe-S cluster assembly protein SufD
LAQGGGMSLSREQCYAQLLRGKASSIEGAQNGAMRVIAYDSAAALGFPSATHDDWRFTDLSPLFQHAFQPVTTGSKLERDDIAPHIIPGSIRLVFVDGCYAAGLSDLSRADSSITVKSLLDCRDEAAVATHLGQHLPHTQNGFAALNTYCFEDGAWVHITAEIAAPIHILHVATRHDAPTAIYPRCLVLLERNAQATLVEDYVSLPGALHLTDAVTEIILQPHARLQHAHLQRADKGAFHIGQCAVKLEQGSSYTSTSLALGARLSRYNLHLTQQGEGVEIHLNGLALVAARQVADTHTLIDHAKPHGKSVQLHKCIAEGAAQAVFGGKIVVHEQAVGTDSAQSSRNLLLSGKARIDTQPQLEIFNDDVSCKHGATVGQIDQDALFFLTSRGLDKEQARRLLTHAFAAEIIEKIPVPALVEALSQEMLAYEGQP